MGIINDTGMKGQDYALAASVVGFMSWTVELMGCQTTTFWIGLIVAEFPANRMVQILPLGKLMSASLIAWGVTLVIMAVVNQSAAILGLSCL